jgi:hypothetical protein
MTTADHSPASFCFSSSVRRVFFYSFLCPHASSSVPATPAERSMGRFSRIPKSRPWTPGGRSKSSEDEFFFLPLFPNPLFAFLFPVPFACSPPNLLSICCCIFFCLFQTAHELVRFLRPHCLAILPGFVIKPSAGIAMLSFHDPVFPTCGYEKHRKKLKKTEKIVS